MVGALYLTQPENQAIVKFEVKVRAGLNIARTSSSVDLTAGLRRDELGWLPPRLTFDADGLSAGEAAAIDHRHRMSAWDSRKPSQFS